MLGTPFGQPRMPTVGELFGDRRSARRPTGPEYRPADPDDLEMCWQDRVTATLAASEAGLRARVIDLEADRDAYRMLSQVALGHAHGLTLTVRRQQETIVRLHEIVREYIGAPGGRRVA
jgi:hypothetical protein